MSVRINLALECQINIFISISWLLELYLFITVWKLEVNMLSNFFFLSRPDISVFIWVSQLSWTFVAKQKIYVRVEVLKLTWWNTLSTRNSYYCIMVFVFMAVNLLFPVWFWSSESQKRRYVMWVAGDWQNWRFSGILFHSIFRCASLSSAYLD